MKLEHANTNFKNPILIDITIIRRKCIKDFHHDPLEDWNLSNKSPRTLENWLWFAQFEYKRRYLARQERKKRMSNS